jgi:hypothetical protein
MQKRKIEGKLKQTRKIDGKYSAVVTIVNHYTGEVLEEGEPLIVFRAKDKNARAVIQYYRKICEASGSPQEFLKLIDSTLKNFERFAADHPERMKRPD